MILPPAVVEMRAALDEKTKGMNSNNCPTSYLISKTINTIWGTLEGDRAHLLVGTGTYATFIKFSIITAIVLIVRCFCSV